MTLLGWLRATPARARPYIDHYEILGIPIGYMALESVTLWPCWCLVPLSVLGLVLMFWVVARPNGHDPATCPRCAERAPYMAGRLARLEDPVRIWRRLRFQHYQHWAILFVVMPIMLLIWLVLLITWHTDVNANIVYVPIMAALFWYMDSMWLYHRYYRRQCPWCTRRTMRRTVRGAFMNTYRQFRRIGNETGRRITARPASPRGEVDEQTDTPPDQSKSRDT